jgi:hypothetical protein
MTVLRPVDTSPAGSSEDIDAVELPSSARGGTIHVPGATPGLQRSAVLAGAIGSVLTMIVVTVAVAAFGGGIGSFGAGIMVAGFDGFPFGAMLGVMIYFLRHPENP